MVLVVSVAGADDRHAGLQIFTAGIGNRDLILPFRIGKIEQRFQFVRFDQRLVVHDDPESAGQADPGIIRRAKLRRDRPVDFPHVQGTENPRRTGQFQAAGIVGQEKICRGSIALSLEPIDEFRRAGREEIDLNAGLRRKVVQDRFDQSFGAARIDRQLVGGKDCGSVRKIRRSGTERSQACTWANYMGRSPLELKLISHLKMIPKKPGQSSMTAARAEAVELKSVGLDGKSVPGGDFFLKLFNFAVFKFDDLAATGADEVIVVALMGDVIVLRL